jgi:glycosyltransferase involved in cell wall biosynthesis
MAVLQVTGPLTEGGVSRVVLRLSQAVLLSGSGVEVLSLGTPTGSAVQTELATLGVKIHFVPPGRGRWRALLPYTRLLQTKLFTAVHCHGGLQDGLFMPIAARAGIPVRILHLHLTRFSPNVPRWYRAAALTLSSLGYSRATHVLGTSVAALRAAEPHLGAFGGTRAVLHPPVAIRVPEAACNRANIRSDLGIPQGAPIVISVGRLATGKNHEAQLRVFAAARRSTGARYMIVGDGPEHAAIARSVDQMGLRSVVHMLGMRADVHSLLPEARAMLFLTQWEAFGMVAVEALAAGVPVVAYDVGGVAEAMGASPTLVPLDNEARATAVLSALLSSQEYHTQCATAGVQWGERFALRNYQAVLRRLYEGGPVPELEGTRGTVGRWPSTAGAHAGPQNGVSD